MRFAVILIAAIPLCAQQQLARDILKQLIEINTTDSVGDNTQAAEAMAARFREAGYPESDIHVVIPAPRKGNLVVRLHGTGPARPILFIGHLDVVEAKRSDWSFDPFVFREQDGYFYGRGTSDMKGDDTTLIAAFLRLKREGFQPVRDMILALTADAGKRPSRSDRRRFLRERRCGRRRYQERAPSVHGHASRREDIRQLQTGSD